MLIKNFHPISLTRCSYKILGKVLAKKLAKVMTKVVSDNHNAFYGEKQILDCIHILNESMEEGKNAKLILKVDFEKAYDAMLWDYLDEMIEGMNFSDK